MAIKTQHKKKKLIAAMEKHLGVISSACKDVGVNRSTYYDYYNGDEEFKAACDDTINIAIDFAESQLHQQIKDGIPVSTIFFLKTKGKSRGYVEKTEVENSGGMQITWNEEKSYD